MESRGSVLTRLYASEDTSKIKESFGVSPTAFDFFRKNKGVNMCTGFRRSR